jgi:uncharacterized membrane protein/protein-disulfide isomerase
MSALSRKLLTVFSLLGLGASAAATYVHYNLIRNPDYSSFCDINATVSCKAAYLSRYGSIAGVPVAVGGLLFFTWVLLLLWGSRGKSRIKDSAPAYIFAGSTLALAVVLYLAYASFFILKEVCPLCVTTYVAVIGVFVISGGASSLPMSRLPGRAVRDLRLLVTTPAALVLALLFVGGAAWAPSAFPRDQIRPVIAAAPALSTVQSTEFERWWDVQPKVASFPFGNEGAKVLIVEFADYQCPQCRLQYFALKPILDKYADRPNDVRVVLKQFPLNADCNSFVPSRMHVASCDAAASVVMARSKGTFEKLHEWLFLHQEELSPTTIRGAAADVARIKDFDAEYPKAIQEVKTDASVGGALGVNSTPTFFINGKKIPGGGLPPQYFEAAIELELKRAK